MKILLDSCVWGGCISEVQAAGHDVSWAGNWDRDPGDPEVLQRAHAEGRVLVTLDKDFGELAIVRRIPHSGIIRLVGGSVHTFGERIIRLARRYDAELAAGAIVTAELERIRIHSGRVS